MQPYHIEINKNFIGRDSDKARLQHIVDEKAAKIVVIYGRRRIGKTELIEQFFYNRNILKFEGLEDVAENTQMEFVMRQLAQYTQNPLLGKVAVKDWVDVLQHIAEYSKTGEWILYFEEVQWLANYNTAFISALKYVWDNNLRHNKKLIIILCGSSPSFMINNVVKSKALYNRSQYEIPLRELNLIEAKAMLLQHAHKAVMDVYLTVGGMPEYLLRFQSRRSVYINLCHQSFLNGAFFSREQEKIFTSSLASNKHYKQIVNFLSKKQFATRNEIAKHLKIKSGGALTELLQDLETCGFIEKYTPYNLYSDSKLARYCVCDAYLNYYFKFIRPKQTAIQNGEFNQDPTNALKINAYQQWLGYSFERFCRKYHYIIAKILGFYSVNYRSGSYFNRKTNSESSGYQIDLLFDRDDHVITICELKYVNAINTAKVIDELEDKLLKFENPSNKTLEKVLITSSKIKEALKDRNYFDKIISFDELFEPLYWR